MAKSVEKYLKKISKLIEESPEERMLLLNQISGVLARNNYLHQHDVNTHLVALTVFQELFGYHSQGRVTKTEANVDNTSPVTDQLVCNLADVIENTELPSETKWFTPETYYDSVDCDDRMLYIHSIYGDVAYGYLLSHHAGYFDANSIEKVAFRNIKNIYSHYIKRELLTDYITDFVKSLPTNTFPSDKNVADDTKSFAAKCAEARRHNTHFVGTMNEPVKKCQDNPITNLETLATEIAKISQRLEHLENSFINKTDVSIPKPDPSLGYPSN